MIRDLTDPGILTDGEISLVLRKTTPADPEKGFVPAYIFNITKTDTDEAAGEIALRVGYTGDLVWYAGHIGYGVHEPFRGNYYAAKACRLVLPLAAAHGMDVLWITCNPDNWASRKTCEFIGAELVGIVDLPEYTEMYKRGERRKCRYRVILKLSDAPDR